MEAAAVEAERGELLAGIRRLGGHAVAEGQQQQGQQRDALGHRDLEGMECLVELGWRLRV
ncbi:MAG: hypothetical protein IPG75_22670 [Gemmatimonadetes bacterium]|nr:hypothetical protein [Gemmatimonadota bacterium]